MEFKDQTNAQIPFQSWLISNPLLPARWQWSTPQNSPDPEDFKTYGYGLWNVQRLQGRREESGWCWDKSQMS